MASAPSVNAEKIEPAVLKKVKQATVYIKVKAADGSISEGSGFFNGVKGIIVTNAHVVNMLDNESRKPVKIEVTINSSDENGRTVKRRCTTSMANSTWRRSEYPPTTTKTFRKGLN